MVDTILSTYPYTKVMMLAYIKIAGEKYKLKHAVTNAMVKQNQDVLVVKQRELEHINYQEFSAV